MHEVLSTYKVLKGFGSSEEFLTFLSLHIEIVCRKFDLFLRIYIYSRFILTIRKGICTL